MQVLLLILFVTPTPQGEVRRALSQLNRAVNRLLQFQEKPKNFSTRRRVKRLLSTKPAKGKRAHSNPKKMKAVDGSCEKYVSALHLPMLSAKPGTLAKLLKMDNSVVKFLLSQLIKDSET